MRVFSAIACGKSPPFQQAPHAPLPQLQPHSGTVLSSVKLVTITWAGYEFQEQVEQFGDFVVHSKWLTTVGSDYGVGAGTHVRAPISHPAPSSLTDVQIGDTINRPIHT